MKTRRFASTFILVGLGIAPTIYSFSAQAASMAQPQTNQVSQVSQVSQVRKILSIDNIQNVQIDIPQINMEANSGGATTYDFGCNLQGALIGALSSKYVFSEPQSQCGQNTNANGTTAGAKALAAPPVAPWPDLPVVPAATLKFTVTALVFRSGGGGDSMFYGFDERFRTIYNDGTGKLANDFPLSPVAFQPNAFDASFNDRGTAPFDSQSGLDLGEGFQFDALAAYVDAKWASYHSEIRMQVEMSSPVTGRHEVKEISVQGHGYFFDIVGGYEQFSGGIGFGRTDAMTAAFNNAFAGAASVIDTWMGELPLTAYLFEANSPTQILLNTGSDAGVPVGTKFTVVGHPEIILEVTQAESSGSVAKIDSGSFSNLQAGMTLVQANAPGVSPSLLSPEIGAASAAASEHQASGSQNPDLVNSRAATGAPVAVASESVSLPKTDLPKADYSSVSGLQVDGGQAFLQSLIGLPLLPYRIWRYFQYDQSYLGTSAQIAAQDPNAPQVDYNDDVTPKPKGADTESAAKDGANYSSHPAVGIASGASSGSGENGAGAIAWQSQALSQAWAKQIGLNQAAQAVFPADQQIVVAVIDTGVDYNHDAIRDSVWVNPNPYTDPLGRVDTNGWDFISGDGRPFDDLYRGTETASAVLAIAPQATIMPVKAFNPWGVTSSAALYGSFQYAVDHGAQIIVCSWATRRETQTMQKAIQYARDHGVLVVAAAGDRGDDLSKSGNAAYPAVYSKTFDNVLTVAGVDSTDKIVQVSGHYSNYDPGSVQIAAPGENIRVADPRNHTSSQTSTGIAAGMVAGQVVRNLAVAMASHDALGTYHDWIKQVLSQADVVPSLSSAVQGGLRLHVH